MFKTLISQKFTIIDIHCFKHRRTKAKVFYIFSIKIWNKKVKYRIFYNQNFNSMIDILSIKSIWNFGMEKKRRIFYSKYATNIIIEKCPWRCISDISVQNRLIAHLSNKSVVIARILLTGDPLGHSLERLSSLLSLHGWNTMSVFHFFDFFRFELARALAHIRLKGLPPPLWKSANAVCTSRAAPD